MTHDRTNFFSHGRRAVTQALLILHLLPSFTWSFDFSRPIVPEVSLEKLPPSLGTLREIIPSQGAWIIHIEDLHCQYQVQRNISSLIGWLRRRQGVDWVGVEGAAFPLDVRALRGIAREPIREAVCDYFLREGQVTGSEAFAILAAQPLRLEGVEDPFLYQASLELVPGFFNPESWGACQDFRDQHASPNTAERKEWLAGLENILHLSAIPEEVARFQAGPLKEIESGPGKDDGLTRASLQSALRQALRFYALADRRSCAMVRNLESKRAAAGNRVAVLVTGGYHASQIRAEARRRHLGYARIAPRCPDPQSPNPYFARLRNQPTELDRHFPAGAFGLALPSYFPDSTHADARSRFFAQRARWLARLLEAAEAPLSGARPTIANSLEAALWAKGVKMLQVRSSDGEIIYALAFSKQAAVAPPRGANLSAGGWKFYFFSTEAAWEIQSRRLADGAGVSAKSGEKITRRIHEYLLWHRTWAHSLRRLFGRAWWEEKLEIRPDQILQPLLELPGYHEKLGSILATLPGALDVSAGHVRLPAGTWQDVRAVLSGFVRQPERRQIERVVELLLPHARVEMISEIERCMAVFALLYAFQKVVRPLGIKQNTGLDLYLLGSLTHGAFTLDSDIDCLLVYDAPSHRRIGEWADGEFRDYLRERLGYHLDEKRNFGAVDVRQLEALQDNTVGRWFLFSMRRLDGIGRLPGISQTLSNLQLVQKISDGIPKQLETVRDQVGRLADYSNGKVVTDIIRSLANAIAVLYAEQLFSVNLALDFAEEIRLISPEDHTRLLRTYWRTIRFRNEIGLGRWQESRALEMEWTQVIPELIQSLIERINSGVWIWPGLMVTAGLAASIWDGSSGSALISAGMVLGTTGRPDLNPFGRGADSGEPNPTWERLLEPLTRSPELQAWLKQTPEVVQWLKSSADLPPELETVTRALLDQFAKEPSRTTLVEATRVLFDRVPLETLVQVQYLLASFALHQAFQNALAGRPVPEAGGLELYVTGSLARRSYTLDSDLDCLLVYDHPAGRGMVEDLEKRMRGLLRDDWGYPVDTRSNFRPVDRKRLIGWTKDQGSELAKRLLFGMRRLSGTGAPLEIQEFLTPGSLARSLKGNQTALVRSILQRIRFLDYFVDGKGATDTFRELITVVSLNYSDRLLTFQETLEILERQNLMPKSGVEQLAQLYWASLRFRNQLSLAIPGATRLFRETLQTHLHGLVTELLKKILPHGLGAAVLGAALAHFFGWSPGGFLAAFWLGTSQPSSLRAPPGGEQAGGVRRESEDAQDAWAGEIRPRVDKFFSDQYAAGRMTEKEYQSARERLPQFDYGPYRPIFEKVRGHSGLRLLLSMLLAIRIAGRTPALVFDHDGTLVPTTSDKSKLHIHEPLIAPLRTILQHTRAVIESSADLEKISGRTLETLERRLQPAELANLFVMPDAPAKLLRHPGPGVAEPWREIPGYSLALQEELGEAAHRRYQAGLRRLIDSLQIVQTRYRLPGRAGWTINPGGETTEKIRVLCLPDGREFEIHGEHLIETASQLKFILVGDRAPAEEKAAYAKWEKEYLNGNLERLSVDFRSALAVALNASSGKSPAVEEEKILGQLTALYPGFSAWAVSSGRSGMAEAAAKLVAAPGGQTTLDIGLGKGVGIRQILLYLKQPAWTALALADGFDKNDASILDEILNGVHVGDALRHPVPTNWLVAAEPDPHQSGPERLLPYVEMIAEFLTVGPQIRLPEIRAPNVGAGSPDLPWGAAFRHFFSSGTVWLRAWARAARGWPGVRNRPGRGWQAPAAGRKDHFEAVKFPPRKMVRRRLAAGA